MEWRRSGGGGGGGGGGNGVEAVITNPNMDWVKLEIATIKFGE